MLKFGILCVLVVCVTGQENCGLNEVYTECGSGCVPTCDSPHNRGRRDVICAAVCVKGCFCKHGFVNDTSDRTCDLPFNCKYIEKDCGLNEVYTTCGSGCVTTCDTFYNRKSPDGCASVCVEGCLCAPGFIKDVDGNCVHPSNCKVPEKNCGLNEVYTECGSGCAPTCDSTHNRGRRAVMCAAVCVRGCFCKRGFVNDTSDGTCVRPTDCKNIEKTCGRNEIYKECGSGCAETCDTHYNRKPPVMCAAVCVKGCFCAPGFIRDINGECVEPSNCVIPQISCRPNEVYSSCGSGCATTCDTFYNRKPPVMCAAVCLEGCFCAPGFIRDIDGSCVEPSKCKIPEMTAQCPENEEKVPCAKPHWCQTCGIRGNCKSAVGYCKDGGCDCKMNHFRDAHGKCVPEEQCPKRE